jgi:hypothetical protein
MVGIRIQHGTPCTALVADSQRKVSGFPFGCANTAAADGRRDSNVYENNPWLWQFGRGKPHMGELTVKQTTVRQANASDARKSVGQRPVGVSRLIRPHSK